MTTSKQRSPYMDNVKAFLIICVVVGHFTNQALSGSHALKSLFVFIYSFHMPLFIFINGLFCKKLLQDKRRTFIRVVFFFSIICFLKNNNLFYPYIYWWWNCYLSTVYRIRNAMVSVRNSRHLFHHIFSQKYKC